DYHATTIALTLILMVQIAGLWRTLTTTNRELTRFLTAVSHNDFTQSFKPVDGDGGFRELGLAFEAIIERFREARSDKDVQAAEPRAFVARPRTPVLALAADDRRLHGNRALQAVLRLPAAPTSLAPIRQRHPQLAAALESLQAGQPLTVQVRNATETRHIKL